MNCGRPENALTILKVVCVYVKKNRHNVTNITDYTWKLSSDLLPIHICAQRAHTHMF